MNASSPSLSVRVGSAVDTLLDRTIAPGYTKLGLAARRRLPGWPADPERRALAGRTAAVTGASSGLGIAVAEGLALLGARVLLVVRDTTKGEKVRREILDRVPGAALEVHRCDVGDLDDVRRFAADLTDHLGDDALDVLVHNAGAMPPERTTSTQGHELSMAVHVLGPVLMTDLLRPRLAASGVGARVVMVTSGGMYAQAIPADDPEYDVPADVYKPPTAYARSKRAQVELLGPLAQRWGGDSITIAAMHPGWADTPGVVDSLPLFHKITGPVLRDADGGADTIVWLAGTSPRPEGGLLWHDRRPRPTALLKRTRATNAQRAELWDWVRRVTQLGV
ncbi:SDR family NAD(P)-dependent oxidoreductase [Nocardioides alkalitolerans]|uniref:SDR family NAD(P)-dependent oxidoreductase n=1 Tax=Nocardioides alkalitolerans TaxID=281714 RepID=UPI0003F74E41|nr:SDR family NAD(P)-dependent oxidoreductase [Nocardioides alkalitolerans]